MKRTAKTALIISAILAVGIGVCVGANADSSTVEHALEDYEDELTAYDNFRLMNPDYQCIKKIGDTEIACHYITEFTVKEATCQEEGYRDWKCGICGEEGRDVMEITGHRFRDGICIWCGEAMPEETEKPEDSQDEDDTAAVPEDAEKMKQEFEYLESLDREGIIKAMDDMDEAALERMKTFILDGGIEDRELARDLITEIENRLAAEGESNASA